MSSRISVADIFYNHLFVAEKSYVRFFALRKIAFFVRKNMICLGKIIGIVIYRVVPFACELYILRGV